MDEQMARLIMMETAVSALQKWQVKRPTRSRRLIGDSGDVYVAGRTFFGNWIINGFGGRQWIKDYDRPRWVLADDCEKVESAETPPRPPAEDAGQKWVLGDYELRETPLARSRPNISGQPQTVNLACVKHGLVPASYDYIRLTRELNGGISPEALCSMMDSWTPHGAKWNKGELKVPCEIIFASNPLGVTSLLRNAGGLTGIRVGEWIWQIDTLNYETLGNYRAETVPQRYIMHLTLSKNGSSIVNPSPAFGGRDGFPVKLLITSRSIMYARKGLLDSIGARNNRYNPPWDKGVI